MPALILTSPAPRRLVCFPQALSPEMHLPGRHLIAAPAQNSLPVYYPYVFTPAGCSVIVLAQEGEGVAWGVVTPGCLLSSPLVITSPPGSH